MRHLAILALLIFALPSIAQTKTIKVQAVGYGPSQPEALNDALTKAVAQIQGASVSSNTSVRTTAVQGSVTDSQGSTESFNASVKQSQSSSFSAKGQVDGYDVLSSRMENGQHRVEVIARVFQYDVPGVGDQRRRIALLQVQCDARGYDFFGDVSCGDLGVSTGAAIESELIKSRKFSVLDRTTMDATLSELDLIGSDLTASSEKAKLGRIKGADYLLLPTIREATDRANERVNPLTGQVRRNFAFQLTLRVVVPATGEVKFNEVYSLPGAPSRSVAIAQISNDAVSDLVEKIYPARIVGISAGGEIIINKGVDSNAATSFFGIFLEGKDLKDPYTGESLGKVERKVGTATVSHSDGRTTYLKLISGDFADIKVGAIARREFAGLKEVKYEAPKATSGVKLPFE